MMNAELELEIECLRERINDRIDSLKEEYSASDNFNENEKIMQSISEEVTVEAMRIFFKNKKMIKEC